ncbi:hypothetical protein LWI28_016659 [Acer negundo]|uniref:Gnk2-homologous domain-containing protein n=1 Tax=Acer negundo TaxID=4023 RepID=A0AAD5IFM0_ACENE|nr:hypothetical protein LWI28_016659 [Acer negundo]
MRGHVKESAGTGNFIANSTYGRNCDLILSSLASKITGGFYNATIGQDRDKVYALALCREDSFKEDFFNCVNFTSQEIMIKCPNQKESFMWGNLPDQPPCMVHYSNRSFFGILEVDPLMILTNTEDICIVQCTPDLSHSDCDVCLRRCVTAYKSYCLGKQEGVVQGPNCGSRWDLYNFYKDTPDAPLTSPPSTSTTTKGMFTLALV